MMHTDIYLFSLHILTLLGFLCYSTFVVGEYSGEDRRILGVHLTREMENNITRNTKDTEAATPMSIDDPSATAGLAWKTLQRLHSKSNAGSATIIARASGAFNRFGKEQPIEKEFDMAIATIAPIKVQLHQTYEMPASVLSNEPVDAQDPSSLRADASCNGVCYLSIIRSLEEGMHLAKVAAHPENATQGFTLVVTDEQMAQAQPYRA